MILFWTILLIILGFILLVKGADIFVDGSAGLAKRLKVSTFIIGLTLVALGTSFPELTVSLIASVSGGGQLAIGNIIGSNIVNIALILGICGLIKQINIKSETLAKYDLPFVILSGIVLFVLSFDSFFQNHGVAFNRLTLGDGIILIIFLIIFFYYIYSNLKSVKSLEIEVEEKEKEQGKESLIKLVSYVLGGLLALIGGGKIVVDNAITLAELFGASQTVIGLTVVAIGTSLPEAITTIVAVMKKKEEMAIGNIIGSNILNILLILGVTSVISPLDLPPLLVVDIGVMLGVSILLYLFILVRKKLDCFSGVIFVLTYIVYFIFIYLREIGS